MALLFSYVRVLTLNDNKTEFLVGGIPRELYGLAASKKFKDFIDSIEEDTELSVHAEAYLYGEGEILKVPIEEVAYLNLRMHDDVRFLLDHCNSIESVDFTCNYSPDELFGMDWRG